MENFIVIAIVVIIVGLAAFYVYKAKKSGKKCIGCPYSESCSSKKGSDSCGGCCGCGSDHNDR